MEFLLAQSKSILANFNETTVLTELELINNCRTNMFVHNLLDP